MRDYIDKIKFSIRKKYTTLQRNELPTPKHEQPPGKKTFSFK